MIALSPLPAVVADVPALIAALKACGASCLITLAPGDWRNVNLDHVGAHATIVGPKAVIHDLSLNYVWGLTFSGLEFSTAGATPGGYGAMNDNWFKVIHSTNITFDGLNVHGDPKGTLATTSSAFLIRYSENVTVRNSEFSYLHHAIGYMTDTHLLLQRNTFHNLYDDAMRGAEISWSKFDGNTCHSNHPDKTDTDHPDCIQMWTVGTKTSTHDISITNNRYDRGTGNSTQFVFFGNEIGLPYYNIEISGNSSYGSGWNGIYIITANNVKIFNNTLITSCKPENGQITISRISTGAVDGLSITDNVAGGIGERAPNTHKTQYNNREAGCMDHSPF